MQQEFTGICEGITFSEVELKGEREHYISGYISTKALDKFNDLITEECLDDMMAQVKGGSIKVDYEHETIHENNLDKNPVARIVDSRRDGKGVWVKAVLNKANVRFKEIWSSIKGGFIDSFSIAFKPVETATKYIQGKAVRVLNKLKLVNVGLTGTPVNEECKLDQVVVKAISNLDNKALRSDSLDGTKMSAVESPVEDISKSTEQSEDNRQKMEEQKPVEQAEVAEVTEAVEVVEEAKVEEAAPVAEVVEAKEVESAEVTDLKEEVAEVKAQLVKIQQQLAKPDMKAIQEAQPITKQKNNVTPLGLIG